MEPLFVADVLAWFWRRAVGSRTPLESVVACECAVRCLAAVAPRAEPEFIPRPDLVTADRAEALVVDLYTRAVACSLDTPGDARSLITGAAWVLWTAHWPAVRDAG